MYISKPRSFSDLWLSILSSGGIRKMFPYEIVRDFKMFINDDIKRRKNRIYL